MKNKEAKELMSRFKAGELSEDEQIKISYWLHHLNEDGNSGLSEEDLQHASNEIWAKVDPAKIKPYKLWPLIAAAVLFCLALAFYFFQDAYTIPTITSTAKIDIAPGGNKAFLTLANGKRIVLTDAKNGELAEESGIKVIKTADGQLVYNVSNGISAVTGTNKIETPAGGQYQVRLPDGTKVWLNAASSLTFPTKFAKLERRVMLSGEAYFEVAKDKRHPFIVKTEQQEVEVLGTHFNINSYQDEPELKTTLLEGSVKVVPASLSLNGNSQLHDIILKPGEQAVNSGAGIMVKQIDAQSAIDWKNGDFIFNGETLESIMRKVSRWYNVQIIYEDQNLKKQSFGGEVSRFANVSEVLEVLELTGFAHFKIEGRRIIIKK